MSEWTLLAFASWTLLAYLGMGTGARVSILVPLWLVTIPLGAIALLFLRGSRPETVPRGRTLRRPVWPDERRRYLLVAGLTLAAASAGLAAILERRAWSVVWATGVLALALVVAAVLTTSDRGESPQLRIRPWEHLLVAATGLVLGAMSLFVNRLSADDVFYVNRATATAQLDRIPVRDVLVTAEQVDPASGVGLPVDSFSALQGAMARLFHVAAPSFAYYVTPPLFTFLSVWALWRLLRLWAPRAVTLCFVVGIAYLLFSAQFNLTPGSYFLSRMWQGKVIFVAWLVPTLYVLLMRWLTRPDAPTALLLFAGAVASIGLTGSATFIAPLIFGSAALVLLLRRDWRPLLVVVGACAIPFAIGFTMTRLYPLDAQLRAPRNAFAASWSFHSVFGVGLVCALATAALWASPWLVRRGAATWITAGVGALTAVLLAPEVLPFVGDAVGAQGALRRTLWLVPFPAVVGLLASVPVGEWLGRRWAIAVPTAAAIALLVAAGQPLWESHSNSGQSFWSAPPSWKMSPRPLAEARAILSRYDGPGPILAEEPIMAAIAELTVDPKAVNPRRWYVKLTGEPSRTKAERLRLTAFVTEERGKSRPSVEQARQDLASLGVALVCVGSSHEDLLRAVQEAGPYETAFRARGQTCLSRSAAPA